MEVHLLDGTYELFRHHFGAPPREGSDGSEVGATRGVLHSVVNMLAEGATHIGVATDHVIESFRNEMWPGYKTGEGVPPELLAQFDLLEVALRSMGVTVWAMVEVEADDALGSAASVAAADPRVERVFICTPDKDLAQCVVDRRVVQLDRRKGAIIDEDGVWEKFGVGPTSIPDYLALVGDSADGFPGLSGWGKRSASLVLSQFGHIEDVPDSLLEWPPPLQKSLRGAAKLAERLSTDRDLAMTFKELATLRVDASLLAGVDDLRWKGMSQEFEGVCEHLRDPALADRVASIARARQS